MRAWRIARQGLAARVPTARWREVVPRASPACTRRCEAQRVAAFLGGELELGLGVSGAA